MPRKPKAPPTPPDEPIVAVAKATGRPSKRTRRRVDRFLTLLKAGHSRTAAAGSVGISRQALSRWMRASAAFRDAVAEAEDQAVVFYEDTIRKAAREAEVIETFDRDGVLLNRRVKYDWKAAQWWLEHRARETYAPGAQQVEVLHTGEIDVTHHKGDGWSPDQGFASQVVQILVNAGKLPPELEPDDVATTLLAAPQPVPAPGDPVDQEAVEPD